MAETLDAAVPRGEPAVEGGDGSAAWETIGRELIARRHRKAQTADRAQVLKAEAAHRPTDLGVLAAFQELSIAERAVVDEARGSATATARTEAGEGAGVRSPAQVPMRIVPVPWPRVLRDVMRAARCQLGSTPRFALFEVAYRPDGRPASVALDETGLTAGCRTAVAAVARMTLADPRYGINSSKQWNVLPMYDEFITVNFTLQ
jgi:hypothetical protein